MLAQQRHLMDLGSFADSAATLSAATQSTQLDSYVTRDSIRVSASDVIPLLIDAALTNRAWLDDFADDHLEIPHDLYEVLLAYGRYRREAV